MRSEATNDGNDPTPSPSLSGATGQGAVLSIG
jgi:hypothetical protein